MLLTAREREVLELMASGATNSQIARELVVSEGTVKSHVKRILRKLRVDNRAGAVARYLHLIRRAGA
jgi:DNA-binding NarL/FixJ family response regulator